MRCTSATLPLKVRSDLGISAIELMPVYEAAPDDYWGYEPTFLLAPRRSYGSPDDLRRFVDAAHAQHMAVILDMVLAHTGHEHPFNRMYPYEHSPWYGSGLGEDNQYGLPTFNYLKEPTNFFVRDVESHDDQRLQQVLQEAGFDDATILKKSMLAATILMTIPGEPMLYQGQEWGEASPVRTEKNTIKWQTAQTEPGEALLAHHQRMSRIRRSRSSIRGDDFAMTLLDEQQRCIVYQRLFGESDQVVVAANFSGQEQNISVPLPQPGYWHEPEGGPFEAQEALDRELEAYTAIVLLSGKS